MPADADAGSDAGGLGDPSDSDPSSLARGGPRRAADAESGHEHHCDEASVLDLHGAREGTTLALRHAGLAAHAIDQRQLAGLRLVDPERLFARSTRAGRQSATPGTIPSAAERRTPPMSYSNLTALLIAFALALPASTLAADKATPRKKDVVVKLSGRLSRGDASQDPNVRTPAPKANRVDAPMPLSR